jgi:putative phosphoesterase
MQAAQPHEFGDRNTHARAPARREGGSNLKIAVFSDSHGITGGMARIIERDAPEMVIHLGDCVRDAEYLQGRFPGVEFSCVAGNGDYASRNSATSRTIEVCGARIFMAHGHLLNVGNGLADLAAAAARAGGCDIALYGHTHVPRSGASGGCLCLNPGSVALPRGGSRRSYATLEIVGGEIKTSFGEVD